MKCLGAGASPSTAPPQGSVAMCTKSADALMRARPRKDMTPMVIGAISKPGVRLDRLTGGDPRDWSGYEIAEQRLAGSQVERPSVLKSRLHMSLLTHRIP